MYEELKETIISIIKKTNDKSILILIKELLLQLNN